MRMNGSFGLYVVLVGAVVVFLWLLVMAGGGRLS